jgi:class 3 adenylate cyclase/tetratricopeptide (TPR) repeat protein
VLVCPACGEENPERARFCLACGSALGAPPAPERRKLATLLFCDMSGSTAMGERVDAESVRELMFSYFHRMREAIERHGGTVEKFVGDAVMAVFGVPHAHEDDALRACRAAWEMQERLTELNEELESRFGTTIALRIGLNTGEVVAGDATSRETMVTGDAVNIAARLEQAAVPGQVLIGEPTYRLVRDAVRVEPVEPLTLKGKSEPMPAYHLLAVASPAPRPQRLAVPLIGREEQLSTLERAFEEALAERACRLVTIVGEPGVGKSRLAAELIDRVGPQTRVLRGHCLSYGEGITYWAVGEIVREAAAIHDEHAPDEAHALIAGLLEGEPNGRVIAHTLAQLLGLVEGIATAPETAWAIRRFLAALARSRPLLVLMDDIQWAETAFLDLLAGLPAALDDAVIFILCLARPDLVDSRPGWEVSVELEPLSGDDVDSLLTNLLGGAPAPTGVQARITRASAGNPLFAEELVGMLVDEGVLRRENESWALERDLESLVVPASLNALLGARLDHLDRDARAALERGAVEGELFHRGSVVELSSRESRPQVPAHLERLAGKDFIRAAEASFIDEAAFRFRHILVREAAYGATAKKLRAELHERFAGWLERIAGDRVTEYEEILGYHLEQSFGYRKELGPVDDAGRSLAGRAAGRLAAAGRRALKRGDLDAATNLLSRARALLPAESRERITLALDLAEALLESARLEEAEQLLGEGIEAAAVLGDEYLHALLRVQRASFRAHVNPAGWSDQALSEAEWAISVFERFGEDSALARAWEAVSAVHWLRGELAAARATGERGLAHAERAGDERLQGSLQIAATAPAFFGLTPLEEATRLLERHVEWARRTGSLWVEGLGIQALGTHEAARGNLATAIELIQHGMSMMSELGMRLYAAGVVANWIWLVTDDPVEAEERLRESYETLLEAGDRGVLGTVAAELGEALYRQGRYADAEEMARAAEETGAADDVVLQVQVRAVRAKLLARRGRFEEAEALAREAVGRAFEQEFVDARGSALVALAEVLRLSGRRSEAAEPLEQALALWEAKGNVVFATRTRALLAELAPATR